jgi:uncharacterized small protein (DUF1192 family)
MTKFLMAADTGGASGTIAADSDKGKTQTTSITTGGENGGGQTGEKKAAENTKTYTEEELGQVVARKQAEQVNKLLTELGIENTGSLKERIAALKKYEDEHKTELQKEKEAREAAEKAMAGAITRAEQAEAKAEAIVLGVDPAKAERFMKLAMTYEGTTVQEKVKAALTDNPEFKGAKPDTPNLNSKIKNQLTPEATAADIAFKQALGLKIAK